MRYEVNTSAGADGRIISTIDQVDDLNVRVTLFCHVGDTRDAQIRAALEKLGWKPPNAQSPPARSKCLVAGCANQRDKGVFVGDVCGSCYSMLVMGQCGRGETFIHTLYAERDMAQAKIKRIRSLL